MVTSRHRPVGIALMPCNVCLMHVGVACGRLCCAAWPQVLATMPLSLHSMEVVNKLAAPGHLPHAVVQLYISNCINACDDIPVS
jgi:hypothetical protein